MKDHSLDELIALAKLAPQMEYKNKEQRGQKKNNASSTPVEVLITTLGLLVGKNEVPTKVLYDGYFNIVENPMDYKKFALEMSKHFKSQVFDNSYFKLNLRPLTIIERVKECNDKEKEDISDKEED